MGFAAYGRTFRLTSSATGVGAPAQGAASAGPYTREAGFWSYYEICTFLDGATQEWIEDQKVPYAHKSNEWVGFDSKESFAIKVQYMKDNKFGGAFVWALDLDDFRGDFCGEGKHPLLGHLRSLINADLPPRPPTTTSKPGVTTTHKPTTPSPVTTKPAVTSRPTIPVPGTEFCTGKADGIYANPEDKKTYYMCAADRTYLRPCGVGTVFEDSCKCCMWP